MVMRRRSSGLGILFAVAMVLSGCDGDGNGGGNPTTSAPGVPLISNLVAAFQQACTIQGFTGSVLLETLTYSDSDGNLRGGALQTTVGSSRPVSRSI
jgi:hypothetical protein